MAPALGLAPRPYPLTAGRTTLIRGWNNWITRMESNHGDSRSKRDWDAVNPQVNKDWYAH